MTTFSRACLIDLDADDNGVSRHINVLDMAVLIGTLGNRTLILTHTITQGFQAFDSLQALGASLHTDRRQPVRHLAMAIDRT
jgi:hypothetical protein